MDRLTDNNNTGEVMRAICKLVGVEADGPDGDPISVLDDVDRSWAGACREMRDEWNRFRDPNQRLVRTPSLRAQEIRGIWARLRPTLQSRRLQPLLAEVHRQLKGNTAAMPQLNMQNHQGPRPPQQNVENHQGPQPPQPSRSLLSLDRSATENMMRHLLRLPPPGANHTSTSETPLPPPTDPLPPSTEITDPRPPAELDAPSFPEPSAQPPEESQPAVRPSGEE
ncbi:hypothetical protein J3E69DRAFT_99194 [Trichoderma sp. SZMC 28015]